METTYTHIIHLADIHIRTGNYSIARVKEYNAVFSSLYENLKKLPCIQNKKALIVLCGDIFHNKTKLESTTVRLWNNLRNLLTKLAPVVLICGNHDYRQEDSTGDSSSPDIIEVLLENSQDSCTYLSETGTYEMGNVVFSLVSIKDTLKSWDSHGIREDLPEFPVSCARDGKINVGLFHGTITQSALPNGQCLAAGNGYPLEWFKGVDLLLLGDNHKQQLNVSNWGMPWAYPGSLIQQDHGEPTRGHGYILWDLEKIQGDVVHIPNNYGFVKMRLHNDECQVRCDGRGYLPIEDVVTADWFPRQPKVAVIGNTGSEVRIRDILKRYEIIPMSMTVSLAVNKNYGDGDEERHGDNTMRELATINNTSRWLDYIKLNSPELASDIQNLQWFDSPENFVFDHVDASLSSDLAAKVKDRREKLLAAIENHKKLKEKPSLGATSSVVLKHMKWSWAFSYGERNHFNFETLEGNIALLNGPNASGKSAFVDVLFIALFGEPTKNRSANTGRKMSSYFIHNQRPPKSSLMNVTLMFEISGTLYEIKRSFGQVLKQDSDGVAQAREASLSVIDKDTMTKKPVENVFTITNIDNWIIRHCGSIDATSMTTIVNQFDTNNFFIMKPPEQRAILDQALNMETFKSYTAILHDAILAYNSLMTMCTTIFNTFGSMDTFTIDVDDEVDVKELDNLKKRVKELEHLRDALQAKSTTNVPVPNDYDYWKNKSVAVGCCEVDEDANSNLMEKRGTLLAKHDILAKEKDDALSAYNTDELEQQLECVRKQLESHVDKKPAMSTTGTVDGIKKELQNVAEWLEQNDGVECDAHRDTYQQWVQAEIPRPVLDANDSVTVEEDWQTLHILFQTKTKLAADARAALTNHKNNRPVSMYEWQERWQDMIQEAEDFGNPAKEECEKNVRNCEARVRKRDEYETKLVELQRNLHELSTQLRIEMHPDWLAQMVAWEERVKQAKLLGSLKEATQKYDEVVALEKANLEFRQELQYLRMRRTECTSELQTLDVVPNYEKIFAKATKHNWLLFNECSKNANQAEMDLQKLINLTTEFDSITLEYDELCSHPFNPNCKACKSHPSHQRKLTIAARIENLKEELKSIGCRQALEKSIIYWQKGSSIAQWLQDAKPIMEKRQKLETALASIEDDITLTKSKLNDCTLGTVEHWRDTKLLLSAIETERPIMQSKVDRHIETKQRLERDISLLSSDIRKIERKLMSYADVDDTLDSWKRALEVSTYIDKYAIKMERERCAWDKWDNELGELQNNLKQCEEAESNAHINAYNAWIAVKDSVELAHRVLVELPIRRKEYESLQTKLEVALLFQSWNSVYIDLDNNRNSLARELRRRETDMALEQIDAKIASRNALAAVAWFECRDVKERLVALYESMRVLSTKVALFERTQGARKKRDTNIATLKRLHQKWMETRDMLVKINTCLVGGTGTGSTAFVEWMYVNHILPLFEKQINNFLRPIENIQVRIQFGAKGNLGFLVHDRGNLVTYTACSGYQKFIIGLAVRQGLARIGGAGCNLNHMVLDESFTACDEQNLGKVELVLQHLMRLTGCKSIILISHLDTIKDAIAKKISVVRTGAFSTLRFGEEYPPFEEEKKRGRPRKS